MDAVVQGPDSRIRVHTQTQTRLTLTSLLVQLVEDVQQLRVHVVDGLEER